jgi:putative membrane protein
MADQPHAPARRRRPRLSDIGSDPDYRYSLANERTFLAWIRTSLALLAGGIAVVQLAPDLGPRALRLTVGIALIVIGGVIAGAAHHRWSSAERAMRLGETLPPSRLSVVLGYGLAIVALVVLIVLIVSDGGR